MSGPAGTPRVTCAVRGGVADVRLNRPDKLNAFDLAMFAELAAAGEALAARRDVRVVVLSGSGRGFSAGLDLALFDQMTGDGGPGPAIAELGSRPGRGEATVAQRAAWVWHELAVPVIAALHGPVLGAGLQVALAADIRLVTADASLSVLEARWGLIPDMAGTYLLPGLVGVDVAKELTWTGRTVSGAEAAALGLATRVEADPAAAAARLAGQVAAASPHAVRHAKRLLDAAAAGGADAAGHLRDEAGTMAELIGSANQREAVAAWFEGRSPAFVDP